VYTSVTAALADRKDVYMMRENKALIRLLFVESLGEN
jgi:hypothetical protein